MLADLSYEQGFPAPDTFSYKRESLLTSWDLDSWVAHMASFASWVWSECAREGEWGMVDDAVFTFAIIDRIQAMHLYQSISREWDQPMWSSRDVTGSMTQQAFNLATQCLPPNHPHPPLDAVTALVRVGLTYRPAVSAPNSPKHPLAHPAPRPRELDAAALTALVQSARPVHNWTHAERERVHLGLRPAPGTPLSAREVYTAYTLVLLHRFVASCRSATEAAPPPLQFCAADMDGFGWYDDDAAEEYVARAGAGVGAALELAERRLAAAAALASAACDPGERIRDAMPVEEVAAGWCTPARRKRARESEGKEEGEKRARAAGEEVGVPVWAQQIQNSVAVDGDGFPGMLW